MMRPRIITLCVLLLAGAIVNVAVAVWLQFQPISGVGTSQDALSQAALDQIWLSLGTGPEFQRTLNGWKMNHFGVTETRVGNEFISNNGNEGGFNGGGMSTFILILQSGLPQHTLEHAHADVMMPFHIFTRPKSLGEPVTWLRETSILWPGFAINSMFYAAVLWVVFAFPRKLRRIIRFRHGLCPACAYPIRGSSSPVCTECGGPVNKTD
jgi:hypothetical protein